ncbi:MAG: GTP pyrophosphokinase family protein [Fusicatenibacter sp.]|nr:GTP pyrophosphokinase family protein [Fusicatenibacter sp.]
MIEKKELEVELEKLEELQSITQPFLRLMMEYHCAMEEIATKLRNLNLEFAQVYNRNPFETIKTRIKSPSSILEKMQRRGYDITIGNLEEKLSDIAGVRVICSFQKDIYTLADLLLQQDDVVLLERKDYIQNPKQNGYRSLHLIVEVPIFLSSGKKMRKVEIQFRTIAMDFWASLDHKLRYKKDLKNAEMVAAELRECAETICGIDVKMQGILEQIEGDEGYGCRMD